MPRRIGCESGQVIPLFVLVSITILLGVAALVIDVGSWYGSARRIQGAADAAALAALQDLPANPAQASADASAYATANCGSTLNCTQTLSTTSNGVSVTVTGQAPISFARFFGINSATVQRTATAQVSGLNCVPSTVGTNEVVPIVVDASSAPPAVPMGIQQVISLGPADPVGPGNFGILDFSNSNGGTPAHTVGDWIRNGYGSPVCTGTIQGITGNKLANQAVVGPMQGLQGTTILLPVYTGTSGAGGQFAYVISGFAAFNLVKYNAGGSQTTMTGSFQRVVMPVSGGSAPGYFGVGTIGLTG
jgi:Flp pilus assembly protein TadG